MAKFKKRSTKEKPSQPNNYNSLKAVPKTAEKGPSAKERLVKETAELNAILRESSLYENNGFYQPPEEEEFEDWHDDPRDTEAQLDILIEAQNLSEEKIPKQAIEAYRLLGEHLASYRSGPMPSLFKFLPNALDWEGLIQITNPHNWTPHATWEATKMFVSNLTSAQAQTFLANVLVPIVRKNIRNNKKLNIHLYNSIIKSIFKPAAFFKGFLFKIAEKCSTKEASIIGSIVKKMSFPVDHVAAAILMLARTDPYMNGYVFFLKLLLMKKYAIPVSVKEELIKYFCSVEGEKTRKLTVLWYQTFLVFVQTYKNDLSEKEREQLERINRMYPHHLISNEVRKELEWRQMV